MYSYEISNEQVKEIADALAAHSFETAMRLVREKEGMELQTAEYADLTRVFVKYAKAGAKLLGSW